MTRHTRNRQLVKATGDVTIKEEQTIEIADGNKTNLFIDKYFEWHRYSVYKSDKLYNVVSVKSDRPWRKWIPVKEME
ncbi:hypothetical protein [Bacillus phage SWEP1]|nr:hypothetical protein [Bacillus phage SWEP1]